MSAPASVRNATVVAWCHGRRACLCPMGRSAGLRSALHTAISLHLCPQKPHLRHPRRTYPQALAQGPSPPLSLWCTLSKGIIKHEKTHLL